MKPSIVVPRRVEQKTHQDKSSKCKKCAIGNAKALIPSYCKTHDGEYKNSKQYWIEGKVPKRDMLIFANKSCEVVDLAKNIKRTPRELYARANSIC